MPSKTRWSPVRVSRTVVDGALVAAPTVRLTLTGDHRGFAGMEGARFIQAIAVRLQPQV